MRILVCPLDWGIGHAVRCLPLIKALRDLGHTVIIAGSGNSLKVLQQQLPGIQSIEFPGFSVKYRFGVKLSLLLKLPQFIYTVVREHVQLKKLVDNYQIDMVISDNRYGLFSKDKPTVFITHQLNIPFPFFSTALNAVNHWLIEKFSSCWIPDYRGENNLSGKLSEPVVPNANYIGLLTSVENLKNKEEIDILVIAGGPLKARKKFLAIVIPQLKVSGLRVIIAGGDPSGSQSNKNYNIQQVDFMNSKELSEAISKSEFIIARSGYSTLMDIVYSGKKIILIPTAGQGEQEYLAERFAKHGWAAVQKETSFDLESALENASRTTLPDFKKDKVELEFLVEQAMMRFAQRQPSEG